MTLTHPTAPVTTSTASTAVTAAGHVVLRVRYVALGLVVLALYVTSLTHLGSMSQADRCPATAATVVGTGPDRGPDSCGDRLLEP